MPDSPQTDYILVGLTGSIGAGKSTVADIMEQAGVPVLRSDLIAKELMVQDEGMKEAIKAEFGEEAYTNGELNRKYLAEKIFSDREKLEQMNAIVHPRTIAEQGVRARKLVEEGNRIVVCEAALIFESGGEGRFDYIVVVDADQQFRYKRAASRDSVGPEEIQKRDKMQIAAEEKVKQADFVIHNDGDLDDLKRKTEFILTLLKSLPSREGLDVDDEGMLEIEE